jgi:quinol-cytochrome oxidoreductase complex cytochrome b subunit
MVLGIHYAVNYTNLFRPDPEEAFASVEYIMRDVEYRWLFGYFTGAKAPILAIALTAICWAIAWLLVVPRQKRVS